MAMAIMGAYISLVFISKLFGGSKKKEQPAVTASGKMVDGGVLAVWLAGCSVAHECAACPFAAVRAHGLSVEQLADLPVTFLPSSPRSSEPGLRMRRTWSS